MYQRENLRPRFLQIIQEGDRIESHDHVQNFELPETNSPLIPPDLGLTRPSWKASLDHQLQESEDEEDGDDGHGKAVNRVRKLRKTCFPLEHRRLELQNLRRMSNGNEFEAEEVLRKKSRLKDYLSAPKHHLDTMSGLAIWGSTIKSIEGRFGSGFGSYFRFLRYLLLFNLTIFITNFLFVVCPQIANRFNNGTNLVVANSSVQLEDFFTAGGWFESTELLYGFYQNDNVTLYGDQEYSMPKAYFFTMGCVYIVWLFSLAITMAYSYRKNFIDGQSLNTSTKEFSFKIFSGWDFSLMGKKATKRKQRALQVELQEMLQKLERFRDEDRGRLRKNGWKCSDATLWILRGIIWFWVVGVVGGIGFATYKILEKFRDNSDFWHQMSTSGFVTLFVWTLPVIFSFLSGLARYGSSSSGSDIKKRRRMYATLFKTMVLQITILAVLLYFYVIENHSENGCWENSVGQEMYRLLVLFLLTLVFISFILDLIQNLIHSRFTLMPIADFDIARESTNLIYGQTVTWIGIYFSPLLPVVFSIILVITFYVKLLGLHLSLRLSQNPHKVFKPWRAAQSRTIFLISTFASLILGSFVIAYTVTSVKPSEMCGPFQGKELTYEVLTSDTEGLYNLFIFYPPVVVGFNIALLVILFYVYSLSVNRHREVVAYRKRTRNARRENHILSLAVKNFQEMLLQRPRLPVRRRSSRLSTTSNRPSLNYQRY